MAIKNSGSSDKVGSKLAEIPLRAVPEDGYHWAGNTLTFEESCKHLITVGASGAGKSLIMNTLVESVLYRFGIDDGIKRRAVVYDSKADLVGFLAGLRPTETIKILNPFDKRFSPWNIAADVTTETDAIEFASILLPKNERDSSPYFADTARALIAGVIKRLNATTVKGQWWTFRDLILAFDDQKRLETILTHPRTTYLLDHFLPDNSKNFSGVKSTADTALSLYRPIAAFFASSTNEPISLKDWVQKEGTVLVLGNHEDAREATDTLNRLIFRQLSKFIIGRSGKIEKDETWIFLDELREMGALSGLRQLLLRGRSKGVAIAMGFQDVEGMYAAYGEHEGSEIIGAAQTLAMLHINATAAKTAAWASQVFASRRDSAQSSSVNFGDSSSQGMSSHLELIPNVFPIEFTSLPMPSKGGELSYFAFTNELGYGRGTYPWHWLTQHGSLSVSAGALDFEAREEIGTSSQQNSTGEPPDVLQPWSSQDLKRLGLKNISLEVGRIKPPKPPPDEPVDPMTTDGISDLLN